jgi:hypothetical protein
VALYCGGPGLGPEVLLSEKRTGLNRSVDHGNTGRNKQITPEHVTTAHGSKEGVIEYKGYRAYRSKCLTAFIVGVD